MLTVPRGTVIVSLMAVEETVPPMVPFCLG